jgi:tetratricopeptide (TPR) repeat protein
MSQKLLPGLLCLGLLSTPALAQPKDDPAKAQAKYEEAERYYKLAEFEAALGLYRESYLLSGEPELLFNIGQCNRQLKRYEEALKNYKAYLRDVPDSPAKADVEKLIQEVNAKIGQPESLPISQPATTQASSTQQKKTTPRNNPPPEKLTPMLLWQESSTAKVGVGTVGASLLLGGTSLLLARRANGSEDDILLSTKQKRPSLALAFTSDILFAVGLGCVGAGWVVEKQKRPSAPRAALQLSPAGTSAAISWEF